MMQPAFKKPIGLFRFVDEDGKCVLYRNNQRIAVCPKDIPRDEQTAQKLFDETTKRQKPGQYWRSMQEDEVTEMLAQESSIDTRASLTPFVIPRPTPFDTAGGRRRK